jgi:hypothetical protein
MWTGHRDRAGSDAFDLVEVALAHPLDPPLTSSWVSPADGRFSDAESSPRLETVALVTLPVFAGSRHRA